MKKKDLITRMYTLHAKAKVAHEEALRAEFSLKIFDLVYDLSLNESYAYQIARNFEFDRFIASKEFEDHEKNMMLDLQAEYKQLIKYHADPTACS